MKLKAYNKLFFSIFIIAIFLSLIFIIIYINYDAERNQDLTSNFKYFSYSEGAHQIISDFHYYFDDLYDDLIYLSELSSLKKYLNGDSDLSDLKEDYYTYSELNDEFYQVRYLDETGMEKLRVDFDGTNRYLVKDEYLQNKEERYYFIVTNNLPLGEFYISPLDLNIENGAIENRGSIEKPEYVPMIRIATPVFNSAEERKGIVILNIYIDFLLEEIRQFSEEGSSAYLVNSDGYYLANPDKEKEFSFMFDYKDHNFFEDFALDPSLFEERIHELEDDNYLYELHYFYPGIGKLEINNDYDGEFWVLISVVEKQVLESKFDDSMKIVLPSIAIFYLIILILGVYLFKSK